MDLFKDIVEGVARGFISSVSEGSSFISASNAVETCCEQLGWTIDERLDANKVCLHFNDPLLGIRKVIVSAGCQETMVGFAVISAVALPAEQVPAAVLRYLLERNSELPVAWQILVREDSNLAFALDYCTFASGLQPDFFKMLCGTMVREVQEFDARMRKAGLS